MGKPILRKVHLCPKSPSNPNPVLTTMLNSWSSIFWAASFISWWCIIGSTSYLLHPVKNLPPTSREDQACRYLSCVQSKIQQTGHWVQRSPLRDSGWLKKIFFFQILSAFWLIPLLSGLTPSNPSSSGCLNHLYESPSVTAPLPGLKPSLWLDGEARALSASLGPSGFCRPLWPRPLMPCPGPSSEASNSPVHMLFLSSCLSLWGSETLLPPYLANSPLQSQLLSHLQETLLPITPSPAKALRVSLPLGRALTPPASRTLGSAYVYQRDPQRWKFCGLVVSHPQGAPWRLSKCINFLHISCARESRFLMANVN